MTTRRRRRMRRNPFGMSKTTMYVVGAGAVGITGLIYYLATRKTEEKKLPGGNQQTPPPVFSPVNPASVAPFFMPQAGYVDKGGGIDENTKWVDAKGNPFTPPAWWQPRFGPPCLGCRPAT